MFERSVDAAPDAIAVVDGEREATYRELERRANAMARGILSRGARRGTIVGLLLHRSIEAYAAMLAIMKCGAAYLPIDPEYPAERIAFMLADAGVTAVIASAEFAARCPGFGGELLLVEGLASRADVEGDARVACASSETDLCYVIYTSGSTGRPKGVMIEHRNAVHLVLAEREIFAIRPDDRVYQGASLCFDLSVEEMWLAFAAGATLVTAPPGVCRAGGGLAEYLRDRAVTVLSGVPSVLATLDDVPTVRLLIFGGEACPDALVARWSRPGRRIVNTYGPTETTVIATYADVVPERPVTIGQPAPGYRVVLLDEALEPVAPGELGEICIGGPAVGRGYVGLPDETARRFVDVAGERLYRSGDLGRLDADGDIHFGGRVDGQVKVRGLRIELTEIESALAEIDGIRAAACAVRRVGDDDVEHLVAYVVPAHSGSVDVPAATARLLERLPTWMVPAIFEEIAALPLLPSGKLDRAALPAPSRRPARGGPGRAPATFAEKRLIEILSTLCPSRTVALDDDFFFDLGGQSLVAARLVTALREDPRFAAVGLADVYRHPKIGDLAAVLDAYAPASERTESAAERVTAASSRAISDVRRAFAAVMQACGLYVVFGLRGAATVVPFFVFLTARAHGPVLRAALDAVETAVALPPLLLFATLALKWTLLGRVRPGRHALWSWYYVRFWFVRTLVESLPLDVLDGTPLLPIVYRLFGATVGRDVFLTSLNLPGFDLLAIGDGTTVERATLETATLADGSLVLGRVELGARCYVGTNAVLQRGTILEDASRVGDLSLISGSRIPAGQTWSGSPARRVASPPPLPERPVRGALQRAGSFGAYAAAALLFPLVELVPLLPGLAFVLTLHPLWALVPASPLVGALYVVTLMAEIVACKWLLLGRIEPGTYAVHSGEYVRYWIVERLLQAALDDLGSVHATLYLKPWLRALGVKLGRYAEVSTVEIGAPDLLEIGDDCTLGDEVTLGTAHVEGGWMVVERTTLGRRVFVGNNAVIPQGLTIGDRSLIGALTVAPSAEEGAGRAGASWVGSPPIELPRREDDAGFAEAATFRPSRALVIGRACFEVLRVTMPGAALTLVVMGALEATLQLWRQEGPAIAAACFPLVFAGFALATILAVVPVKWLVVGRYRPFRRPFWSMFLWKLELVNALYEFLAIPLALDALQGTPFLVWYMRLLGAKIGHGVCLDSVGFLEWDMVEIGDRAILNRDSILQTHLFEDRVLKASRVTIGADCELGTHAIVLYDGRLSDGVRLGALSLVMKGETLAETEHLWVGSPVAYRRRDVRRAG
jgi:non-ribosomal peptide synthetase-like protein